MSNLIIEFLRIECTISILVHDMHCTKRERHQICEGVRGQENISGGVQKVFGELSRFKKIDGGCIIYRDHSHLPPPSSAVVDLINYHSLHRPF